MKHYLASLPERVLRSATALSTGLLREVGDVAIPGRVRRTKLYRTMVEGTLRFLLEEVGRVEGTFPAKGRVGEDFVLRRAAGNGIEFAGILAFRASPVWVMAALADASGAGRRLVQEIATCLKKDGLLDPATEFASVDHILDGLERLAGRVADTVNTPPLDVAGLRREWNEIRECVRALPPEGRPQMQRLWRQWRALRRVAADEERSVFEVSSVMALDALTSAPDALGWLSRSTGVAVRRTGEVFAAPLLDHYRETLGEIRRQGFAAYWSHQYRPYLQAAAAQFARDTDTLTERLLRHPR